MSTAEAGGEYLRPSEAAKLLHVSPKTIDRWAADGRIPCIVTLGGHRRFRVDDVLAVAEQMARRAEPVTEGREKPAKTPKTAKTVRTAKPVKATKPKGTSAKRRTSGERRGRG